jgi:leucyl aminopeptidase
MQVHLRSDDVLSHATALLAVPCFEDVWPADGTAALALLDKKLDGLLTRIINDEQWKPKKAKSLLVHTHGKLPAERILLVGLGNKKDFHPSELRNLGAATVKMAWGSSLKSCAVLLPDGGGPAERERAAQLVTEGLAHGNYKFDKYLTGEKKRPKTVETATVLVAGGEADTLKKAVRRGEIVAGAVQFAGDLINEPAGYLTPTKVAELATELAKQKGLSINVLGPAECKKLGMGMFLGVAQGSHEEPRVVHLTYKPKSPAKGNRRVVALIGKGVTFDSGGLSLKPSDAMVDMKVDMSGGAAVIAAIGALADLACPVEVHAFSALTENMPSGTSYKLGDVLQSMDGKTVEINNTDAEGRLTLGDAITYAKKECSPTEIFDFATLTGACMVALGPYIAGVFSNDDKVVSEWLDSAKVAGEEMWRMPLPPRLMEQLKSDVADMRNTGARWGGALTAGLFLKEFVGDTPWVHVDLAGPASTEKESGHVSAGGTGFAVATIVEHLARE